MDEKSSLEVGVGHKARRVSTKPRRHSPLRRRLLLGALLTLSPRLSGEVRAQAGQPTLTGAVPFLFGCDWPTGGSDAVKALFYETGCNFVRLTGGGYGWALEGHRKALRELNTHGVRVLLQLGSHYPDARYFAFKDAYLVDQKGETGKEDRNSWAITYNGSAWPQYSYASETFRKELVKDFTAYLDGLKDERNIAALLLHNEPGYHWLEERLFDYNPQAIARFRVWLKQQHGTVEKLNERWATKYPTFDAVEPPHEMAPVQNMASWLDWRRFHADLIQDFLADEIAFARRVKPGVPVTTNLPGPLDNWYPIRLGDNYRFTSGMDIAGIDIYPAEWTNPVFPGYVMDQTRGAAQGRPIHVAECEVFDPTRFKGLSETQRAGMLRSQVWTFIGHGADGILLWSLSGQQGFRLTEGQFNERVAATREMAHYARMLRVETFVRSRPPVAVCLDQDSYLYYGGQQPKLEGGTHAYQNDKGMYGAVVAGGYEADVISIAQIRGGTGKQYKALFLSTPILSDQALATQLSDFVTNGGLLVVEAPFAERDRWGRELPEKPGFGLDKVLGIRGIHPDSAESGEIKSTDGTFQAAKRTQFDLAGATVIGTFADGKPAIALHKFGKGTAIYIAAEVSGPNAWRLTSGDPASFGLGKFAAACLTRHARLRPSATRTHNGAAPLFLDMSVRRNNRGNQLIVLTNPPDKGKPLAPATGVTLTPSTGFSARTRVYLLLPERRVGGRIIAGPEPLTLQGGSTGIPALRLPDIDSALPVLLANNFTPLLRIDAPGTAASGSEIEIRVTCYNPSPRPIRLTPSLVLPIGWQALGTTAAITLPEWGEQTVTLRARSGGGERSVVKALVVYMEKTQEVVVESVPVDIRLAGA